VPGGQDGTQATAKVNTWFGLPQLCCRVLDREGAKSVAAECYGGGLLVVGKKQRYVWFGVTTSWAMAKVVVMVVVAARVT